MADKTTYLLTFANKGSALGRQVLEISDFQSAIDALYVLIRGGAVDIRVYKTEAF